MKSKNKFKILLTQLKKEITNKKFWNISYELGFELEKIVREKKPKKILELGTSNGYSTIWILKGLENEINQIQITTVDVDSKRLDFARENFKKLGVEKNILLVESKICDFLENCEEKYDLIFLDAGQKTYLDIFKKIEEKKLYSPFAIFIADNILSHKSTENLKNYLIREYKDTYLIKKDTGFIVSRFN